MYVFKPTVGMGKWSSASTARAQSALRIVDSIYSHIAVNTLSVYTGTVAYIPHTRIKFVLVGNLNIISNDGIYSYMPSAQSYTAYDDPTVINIYYGRAYFNGFYSNGDSSYWAQSSVDPPLPNNHVYNIFGRPSDTTHFDLGDITYSGNLAHELGHALGLYHSTAEDPNIVAYGGYSYINSNFGCCAQMAANDYRLENPPGWNPCGTANSSNNLMQETNGCQRYLSPQQMAIMHYNLVVPLKSLLTTKGYNDATTVNHSSDYSVTANETWTSDRYFKGDITVKANKTLTVKCLLAMTRYAKIVIEAGEVLAIDGGTITNISGRLWDGIYIKGDPGQPQLTPNSANPGSVLHQGLVRIKNGGTISQAMIGVRNYYNNYQGGGYLTWTKLANSFIHL